MFKILLLTAKIEKKMTDSLQEYFMTIAEAVSVRSTCDKLQVGAVIVRGASVIATGHNEAVKGHSHCREAGHKMPNGHSRTVHAETNAIGQAALVGVSLKDADIYTTSSPCWNCFKLISACGIKKIYFRDFHKDATFVGAAKLAGIELEQLDAVLKQGTSV